MLSKICYPVQAKDEMDRLKNIGSLSLLECIKLMWCIESKAEQCVGEANDDRFILATIPVSKKVRRKENDNNEPKGEETRQKKGEKTHNTRQKQDRNE